MKQKIKTLIEWIKLQLELLRTQKNEIINNNVDNAIVLLNLLPEIEKKLCQGGYIQDVNGVPCCNGDKIKQGHATGILCWSKHDYRFYRKTNDTLYLLNTSFRKVE